ncbi:MAG TPA: ABC transporter permease [Thermomicrobiales bacterium]|jgi:peptide/nickel transport system permease protein|nr:ABC transporter permease [Thermomicrobiales bacterium]
MTVADLTTAPSSLAGGRGRFRINEQTRRSLRRFRQSPLSVAGAVIVVALILVAGLGPFLVPFPQDARGAVHVADRLNPPSAANWFGTDQMGRDVFSRVIIGARVSLLAGVTVITLALVLGTVLGAIAGFFRGWISDVIMRVTDVFLTIPDLILAMAFAAALGPGLLNVMIAVSLVWWPGYCRLVRASVITLRDAQFSEAATALGASRMRVLFRHVMPNAFPAILVKASMDIGFAVLTTAALGFIGLGTQPPTPDWGQMISDGRSYVRDAWWFSTFPGIAILLTVLATNLMGDGLRDAFDPRHRGRA